MAGINLSKGGKINLSKEAPGLTNVLVGLSWGENKFATGTDYDLDCSVFCLKADPTAPAGARLLANEYFVFYGSAGLSEPEGAVKHSGDNRTGNAPGIDESITVHLDKLNPQVDELSFIVTIHEADLRKQNFGQIPGSSIALYNADKLSNGAKSTPEELAAAQIAIYSLEDDASGSTAMQFGSLKKRADGAWQFGAAGNGYTQGLGDFVLLYGGTLA